MQFLLSPAPIPGLRPPEMLWPAAQPLAMPSAMLAFSFPGLQSVSARCGGGGMGPTGCPATIPFSLQGSFSRSNPLHPQFALDFHIRLP